MSTITATKSTNLVLLKNDIHPSAEIKKAFPKPVNYNCTNMYPL